MKKVVGSLLVIALFSLFPINVFAAGGVSVSTSSMSMEIGGTQTFNIVAENTIGDATIISNDSGIATVNASSWETGMVEEKKTVTKTITVKGISEGTTTITVSFDGATFDEEKVSVTKTISVTVKKKQGPLPSQVVKPSQQTQQQPQQQAQPKEEPKKEEIKKSNNSKLKEIAAVGYDLMKTDDTNYRLSVENEVSSVVIKAVAEDEKATITGNGEHNLVEGENSIEIVITAEDGSQNKININVLRKEEVIEEEPIEEDITTGDISEPEKKSINVIAIAMIALNVILAISVVSSIIKNNKLKKMNN